MSVVKDMVDQLIEALKTVDGLRVYQEVGASESPPMAVLGPPSLTWEVYDTEPTSATFQVAVVVAMNERALERLWEFAPLVAAAVDTVPNAAVIRADPGAFESGGAKLPAYNITVECSL